MTVYVNLEFLNKLLFLFLVPIVVHLWWIPFTKVILVLFVYSKGVCKFVMNLLFLGYVLI
jgi:hypothetical protein